jgi:hypothetical protein
MAKRDFQIFLSAVTSEFGKARDALAADLRSREALVRVQSDFRQETEADTTLKKLHDYICECSAVVFIAGKRSGAFPPAASTVPFNHMLPPGISKASYTQWEFCFARHYKRRLSIYVADAQHIADAPAAENDDPGCQTAFLSYLLSEQGLDWNPFSTEDRLCRLVLKEEWPGKRQGNSPGLEVEFERLPFLVDRQPQVWRICASVAEQINGPANDSGPQAPALFILPSWENDAVDMFHWRITDKDGPEYCEFDANRDSPYWVGQRLTWPMGSSAHSFRKEFIRANLPYLRTALRVSQQRRRPLYLRTLVGIDEITADFRSLIDAWITCWPEILGQASQASKSDPQQPRLTQPVVGLLILQYKRPARKRWQFWKSEEARVDPYYKELKHLRTDASIGLTVLPPLSTVTFQNANEWLELPDLLNHNIGRSARDLLQQMFGNRKTGVPMEEFAKAIHSLPLTDQTNRQSPNL